MHLDQAPDRNVPHLSRPGRRSVLARAAGVALAAGSGSLLLPGTAHAQTVTTPRSGTHDGHYYQFWTDGTGTVAMTLGAGGRYGVDWSGCGNFVAGKGWATGGRRTVQWSGGFAPAGNGYLSVYGWARNPLVEYYIIDGYGSYRPAHPDHRGTLSSDGQVYDLYRTVRYPSGGTQILQQYWSVNRGTRTQGGTVTTGNHFDAWSRAGMTLGGFEFMIVATEGYRSSGRSDILVG
ncbi:glycoside hydrolase family 11 protein [Streptomyces fragilis]|uniref:Endo-1,4-beta-xylanase n=1 Tax=Streptomyces fragilis TaxID=67301 RepID=A0ABV2YJ29_9ACTN|nr:glycoside hydrolase family 11 protein [Streptomyces fragilis]